LDKEVVKITKRPDWNS